MSKKISLINDPKVSFIKPKFVQWADTVERVSPVEEVDVGLEVGICVQYFLTNIPFIIFIIFPLQTKFIIFE